MKELIKKLDSFFFAGLLLWIWREKRRKSVERALRYPKNHKMIIYSKLNGSPLLAELCDKYGSDKGVVDYKSKPFPWSPHSYTELYTLLFGYRRNFINKVFECGLGTSFEDTPSNMTAAGKPGASLRVWRDYFPNAIIVGADIDTRILFSEDRIQTHYVDQTDPESIKLLWNKIGFSGFDFMIDDGLHTFEAGKCLLENSIEKLSDCGIYIIEDVSEFDLIKYKDFLDSNGYRFMIVKLDRAGLELGDNCVILIEKGKLDTPNNAGSHIR